MYNALPWVRYITAVRGVIFDGLFITNDALVGSGLHHSHV